jgi:Rhodopirellula transposase DDE domain
MSETDRVREKYKVLQPLLNERCLRLWAATEARSLGHGGIKAVATACGLSRRSIERGLSELQSRAAGNETVQLPAGRVRRPGGGRKTLLSNNPNLVAELEHLVDSATRGDPMSPLRWTSKSTEKLAKELQAGGHQISARSVAKVLKNTGYSLQVVRKTHEGGKHEDRDEQFEHINTSVKAFQACGEPVISIDAKKKELIGNFTNKGKEWHPKGQPKEVNVYDFVDKELGKVTPYGVLDIAANEGWVSVGIDHDTAEFAAESIRCWWREMGCLRYPKATRLLITADGGGSNGVRVRLWKKVLQGLATGLGLEIHVCHFPPGTSKWNKIEHRMFCQITQNWRGRPLMSRQVVVNLIGQTTTKTGLRIKAALDENIYPTKQKVSDAELAAIKIIRHEFHGEWNYYISP